MVSVEKLAVRALQARFAGCLVGAALGDAIGELAFSCRSKDQLDVLTSRSRILRYTDDTAMTIGLTQSLIARGEIDDEHLGDTFRTNYRSEPWRGYGPGLPTVFATVECSGVTYQEAAHELYGGEGSFGNGAAMRAAPVGLFYHSSPALYAQAYCSATVTHTHPIGVDGAAVVAWSVGRALRLSEPPDVPRWVRELVQLVKTREMQSQLGSIGSLLGIADDTTAGKRLGRGVAAHESVPFAVYAFLRYSESYRECLCTAVLRSGDRDTVGCMAGAISGAYLGLRAIPDRWRQKLERGSEIERLAQELYDRSQKERNENASQV
jgi:poly(ADP-ribose) glycohydrolase ARH3